MMCRIAKKTASGELTPTGKTLIETARAEGFKHNGKKCKKTKNDGDATKAKFDFACGKAYVEYMCSGKGATPPWTKEQ